MGKNINEDSLIRFDDLNVAAAHARMTGRNFKWIAADFTKSLIFGYNIKPEIESGADVGVWSYNIGDKESQDKEYLKPIGIYTGDIPWNRTLQCTIEK